MIHDQWGGYSSDDNRYAAHAVVVSVIVKAFALPAGSLQKTSEAVDGCSKAFGNTSASTMKTIPLVSWSLPPRTGLVRHHQSVQLSRTSQNNVYRERERILYGGVWRAYDQEEEEGIQCRSFRLQAASWTSVKAQGTCRSLTSYSFGPLIPAIRPSARSLIGNMSRYRYDNTFVSLMRFHE